MPTLTSFGGLADGTNLALRPRPDGNVEKWTFSEGKLHKGPHHLDLKFFQAMLAEGLIWPGDFSPPVAGEWFEYGSYLYLTLASQDTDRQTRAAQFYRGTYRQQSTLTDLADTGHRVPEPEWASPNLLAMAQRIDTLQQEAIRLREETMRTRNIRTYVRRAKENLDYLSTMLGPES
jgi:hypothetical protein